MPYPAIVICIGVPFGVPESTQRTTHSISFRADSNVPKAYYILFSPSVIRRSVPYVNYLRYVVSLDWEYLKLHYRSFSLFIPACPYKQHFHCSFHFQHQCIVQLLSTQFLANSLPHSSGYWYRHFIAFRSWVGEFRSYTVHTKRVSLIVNWSFSTLFVLQIRTNSETKFLGRTPVSWSNARRLWIDCKKRKDKILK